MTSIDVTLILFNKNIMMRTDQKRQTKILSFWVLAWVGSFALLTFGVNNIWQDLLVTKIGLLITLCAGIGMVVANKNLFRAYDEFQKKIHYEAMALTLGLTVVIGLAYEASFDFGVIDAEPEFEYLVFFISLCYMVSILLNSRRYQ